MIATIGVYKTDVTNRSDARRILTRIRKNFPDASASFDLDDCDHVLRVETAGNVIPDTAFRKILTYYGYTMEILP